MPFATIDAVNLHYLDAGSGEPAVVLLHAFPLTAAMWQVQIDGLADRWRVIAPDLAPEQAPEPSMDAMADSVAGLLGQLGVENAVLGGLSMGGYVVFAFLRRHRDVVRGVVLADTRASADTDEARERRSSQQAQVQSEGTAGLVETMVGSLLSEQTRENHPEVVDLARELMQRVTPDHVVAALEAMKRRPDSTNDLPAIDLPTLVMVGEHDGLTPPAVAEEMAQQLPQARLMVIPEAGHLSNLEAPEVFTAELRSFLQSV